MALLFADNFGGYQDTVGLVTQRYTQFGANVHGEQPFPDGRAYSYQQNVPGQGIRIAGILGGGARVIGGAWLRLPGNQAWGTTNSDYLYFWNAALTSFGCLSFNAVGGKVTLSPGKWSGGRNLDSYTTTTELNDGLWHFIEWDLTWSATVGVYKVWVDGNLEVDQSGLNNITSGSPVADTLWFSVNAPGNYNIGVGPFYTADNTGSGLTGASLPLKSVTIRRVRPSADTATKQWTTTSSGTNHFDRINEAVIDGDTTYVEDSTSGHQDLFDFTDLPTTVSATIKGVMSTAYVKQASGSQGFKQDVKTSSTTLAGTNKSIGTGYLYSDQAWDTDATGTGWTLTTLNSSQFGFEVV